MTVTTPPGTHTLPGSGAAREPDHSGLGARGVREAPSAPEVVAPSAAEDPRSVSGGPPARMSVGILGAAMTDMSRRDLGPDEMLQRVVRDVLGQSDTSPGDLGLILVGNALGGRLCDQGCIRGQVVAAQVLGLGDVPMVNVDNSCAGGSSALHLGVLARTASDRPVLVVGVEKMWTGDRAATLAGIEDGLPADYRADMHARFGRRAEPGRQHAHEPERRMGRAVHAAERAPRSSRSPRRRSRPARTPR